MDTSEKGLERETLTKHLAETLDINRFRDYCPNGLQVEGKPHIRRLVTGVTASLALLDAAIEEMINYDGPVIFDCLVDKVENCFPMIPSGKAHNDMLLADLSDDAGLELGSIIDEKGKMLV